MTQRLAPSRRDDGMTLVEVVVALGLLAIMATAVLAVLGSALRLTRDDKARVAAVNLAMRELEITRDTFTSVVRGPDKVLTNRVIDPSPLPGGTAGQPLVVNGVPFTVVRTAQWAPVNGAAASTCDEGTTTELAYLKVKIQVSWPELGDRPPVTMETVMTPPKGTYSSLAGHIGLKVIDAEGKPRSGVQVTAKSASGTVKTGVTSDDGCALLAFLDAGSYAITVSTPGFVNPKGDPAGTLTAQVQPGQLWRGSIEYDQAATITVTFATEDGFPAPTGSGMPLTLGNSALQPVGTRTVAGSGDTRVITNLWPYPSGYQVWAGGCQDSDPQYVGDVRALPVPATPGGSETTAVPLGAVEVHTTAGATVVAKHAADGLCPSGASITLGTANGNGVLRVSLPYGEWTLSAGTPKADVGLFQGDAPQTVTLS